MNTLRMFLTDAFWSALAALGFALLFSVPRRYLPGCILAGALGHGVRVLCTQAGASLEAGTLVGAGVVGIMSLRFSRAYGVPMSLFSLGAVIPLVPGVLAYKTMLGMVSLVDAKTPSTDQAVEVFVLGARTGLVVGAIAFGVIAPTLLFQRDPR